MASKFLHALRTQECTTTPLLEILDPPLSLIRRDAMKLLLLSGQVEPEDVVVLLTAPTGVAAFNIQGMTIHSALLLGTLKFSSQPLTQDKLNIQNKAVQFATAHH